MAGVAGEARNPEAPIVLLVERDEILVTDGPVDRICHPVLGSLAELGRLHTVPEAGVVVRASADGVEEERVEAVARDGIVLIEAADVRIERPLTRDAELPVVAPRGSYQTTDADAALRQENVDVVIVGAEEVRRVID